MRPNSLISAVALAVIALVSTVSFAQDAATLTAGPDAAKSNATTVARQPTAPLSSAKTIRELLDTDDAIALSKERKLLAEEQKRTDKDMGVRADSPDVAAQALRSANETKLANQREAKLLASTIRIDSVMGVQGDRVVNANVAGRQVALKETGSNPVAGWRMLQINGACVSFERVTGITSKKRKSSDFVNRSSSETIAQTVCFKRPELVMATPAFAGQFPSGQVPLPLPMPTGYNTPVRVVPFMPAPTASISAQ